MNWVVADSKTRTRFVVRFPPTEFDRISESVERLGGTQHVGERLLQWFANQDAIVQAMVLGHVPASPDYADIVHRALVEHHDPPKGGRMGGIPEPVDMDRPPGGKGKPGKGPGKT